MTIIIIIIGLVACWAAWSTWQNTKAIKSLFQMTDDLNTIVQAIIKHANLNQ